MEVWPVEVGTPPMWGTSRGGLFTDALERKSMYLRVI